jgi:hypothetical protein
MKITYRNHMLNSLCSETENDRIVTWTGMAWSGSEMYD